MGLNQMKQAPIKGDGALLNGHRLSPGPEHTGS